MKVQRYLTLKEVAEFLSISVDATRTLLERRRLGYHKIGGRIKISEDDLDQFLQASRVKPSSEMS